ncbi:hypothetical protein PTH_1560 [Pelotomaculum thermopropionicum SI]|uniref:Uncharacterized protein n=1 Tax=Pelotomaculum thermopropionicum (strain DSM 13744 / JCM 10971 / SI) TaxID=370438 RepID=A5D1X4_PELTS|nr:hypothetical protein PTH_1560 [Pelotomaculum thermopropionicum SI]
MKLKWFVRQTRVSRNMLISRKHLTNHYCYFIIPYPFM